MPSRTLYVRDEDCLIWKKAEKLARERKYSLSTLVVIALNDYIHKMENNK